MVTVDPYSAVPVGTLPMTAPYTTVGLYCCAEGGHTPTRCTAASAETAAAHEVKEVRGGMVTGGGPVDTTTPMVEPSLAVTGRPLTRGWGCWLRISPGATVMLARWPVVRTVNLSARTSRRAWGR